jgi:hypothetical protein
LLGASAVDLTKDPELVGNLATAATQLDRLAYLSQDSDWTFDFTAQKYYSWSPGGVINMNVATFPAVEGNHLTSKSSARKRFRLSPTPHLNLAFP